MFVLRLMRLIILLNNFVIFRKTIVRLFYSLLEIIRNELIFDYDKIFFLLINHANLKLCRLYSSLQCHLCSKLQIDNVF